MRSSSSGRSGSSRSMRYVRGQGSHSMSDSPYYEHFPQELKKLRKRRGKTARKTRSKSSSKSGGGKKRKHTTRRHYKKRHM